MVMNSRSLRSSGLVALSLMAALAVAPRRVSAAPLFTEDTLKSLGTGTAQACADSGDPGCYTNWFVLADLEKDGDFDFLMANGGGLFGPGNLESAVVYLNDSKGSFFNATHTSFEAAPSQVRQIAVGDIDGDGDLDIYQPGAYGTDPDKLWVQVRPAEYVDLAHSLLPANSASRAGSVHFGDLDGDGDLDLVVADWGDASAEAVSKVVLYDNDGKGSFTLSETQADVPAASHRLPATIPATSSAAYYGSRPTDLDLVDVDGDFDLDILVSHRHGYSRIFLNDGKGSFTDGTAFNGTASAEITAKYAPKQGPFANNQDACDLDGDGDLDLVLDNAGKAPDGTPAGLNVTQVLINDGQGAFFDQTATRIIGEPAAVDGAVKCADVNGDGHYDIVVGSRTHSSEKVLLNDGAGIFTYAADALPKFTDLTLAIDIADLNGDGKLDLVTGQGEGTITPANAATLRNNRVYYGLVADTTPPRFRAIETPVVSVGAPIVFRVAVEDSATSQVGQMASFTVPYTVAGATKQAQVVFIGGDLFRVTIPAQADGTVVNYTLTAVDRAKLTTKVSQVIDVGTPPVVVGEGGAGGEAGSAGAGGTDEASGAAGAAPEPSAGTGGSGVSGGSGASGAQTSGGTSLGGNSGEAGTTASPGSNSSNEDGCSCSTAPTSGSRGFLAFGFGLTLLGLIRRRRSQN